MLLFISCRYLRRRPAEKKYEAVQEGSGNDCPFIKINTKMKLSNEKLKIF